MLKRVVIYMVLAMTVLPLAAQEQPQTLPPNYRLIKKLVKKRGGPYYYDSLLTRFSRCDTTFSIDDARCLYFGGTEVSVTDSYRRYNLLINRFGRHEGLANDAWWQFQMLQSAIWSTGDGTEERPLYVQDAEDLNTLDILEGSDGNVVRFKVRRKMVYECRKMPDGSLRWYCYRKCKSRKKI